MEGAHRARAAAELPCDDAGCVYTPYCHACACPAVSLAEPHTSAASWAHVGEAPARRAAPQAAARLNRKPPRTAQPAATRAALLVRRRPGMDAACQESARDGAWRRCVMGTACKRERQSAQAPPRQRSVLHARRRVRCPRNSFSRCGAASRLSFRPVLNWCVPL